MKRFTILIILINLTLSIPQTFAKQTTENRNIQYLNIEWWNGFKDENLNNYLSQVLKNNQDLKIASIKTKQSKEVIKQAFANQLPQLYFNGNIQREFTSSTLKMGEVTIPDYNQARYYMPLTMSYEVDIWGENYLKTKSLKKQTQMINEDERAVYISITSDFAANYYTLIGIDKLIENQSKLLDIEKNIVKLEEQKYQSGLCPIYEVLSERQTFDKMQERYNYLKERQDILQNQMIMQLGDRFLKDIKRSDYKRISTIKIPSELSTELIQYRPDIKKAEYYIEKTGIDIKTARRDFLPKFTIYGQAGFNAYDWCRIFAPHTFLSNIGIVPHIDLFTGGYKRSKLRYSKLEYEKALLIYEKTILTSIQELNDAMMSVKTSSLNYEKSLERFDLEKEKLNLANYRFQTGAASKLDNLKDSQAVLILEEELVTNNINRFISSINLYKATGGKDYTKPIEL